MIQIALFVEQSLLWNRWARTANQVVFIDVDNFHRLVDVCEWNGPVSSNRLVVIDRALVVTVMQSAGTDERIDFAFVETIHERFHDNLDIVHGRFLEESKSSGTRFRHGPNDLVLAGIVNAEDRSVLAFHRVEDRHAIVSLIFPELVFHTLAQISRHRNGRQSFPEDHVLPEHSRKAGCQRTAAAGE